jgi:hypothetical protein
LIDRHKAILFNVMGQSSFHVLYFMLSYFVIIIISYC